MKTRFLALTLSAVLPLTIAFSSFTNAFAQVAQSSKAAELAQYQAADKIAKEHLAKFDTLDFEVFTNQQWDRFKESHTEDVVVVMPDGSETKGLATHVAAMKALFSYAPDTRIKEHPVRIGSGEWTSVIGAMEGTFTQPMILPDGTKIPATGKSFKLPMVTVGHWVNGRMDKEYLFWDNLAFMKQMGLSK